MRKFLLVAFCTFGLLPLFTFAQTVPDPVQYIVAPEAPGPNQQTTIEAQGVGSFLSDATITWTVDGKVGLSGLGQNSFSFTAGAAGHQTVVGVSIRSSTQGNFSKQFVFNPSLVNLVWEADTTVPPLFKGKALYSAGSPLKVVAFPIVYSGSTKIAASALSYQWSHNDEPDTTASGLGRSTYSFVGDQLQTGEDVTVNAYYGSTKVAHGETVIPATTPALVLYQHDPLRGTIYDTAFPASITLLGQEITLQAQPFYFSRPDAVGGALTYSWQLNGEDATGPDASSGILTLRRNGAGTGAAQVDVSLQDYGSDTFVQQAAAALQLIFGNTSAGTNLFDL